MSKNGYNSSTSRSQFQKTKNTSNIQFSRQETEYRDFDIDSDFFEDLNPSKLNNIILNSTEPIYDIKSNRKIQTRTSYKKNEHTPERKINQTTKDKNRNKRISKNSNFKNEVEKQKALYLSPDFQSSSPHKSSLFFDSRKDSNDIQEIGFKTNYVFESRKINGRNVGTYSTNERYEYINRNGKKEFKYEKSNEGSPGNTEIISPVGYLENTSGSENEENQMRSFDNYQYSIRTDNTNRNRYHRNKNVKKEKDKLNYELEDPEGFDYLKKNQRKVSNDEVKNTSRYINRSQFRNKINESYKSDQKDFQSPDRNITETKKFRKTNMGMIDSKGPSNDDRKITKSMTREIVTTTKTAYKNGKQYINKKYNSKYSEDKNERINAAKIIQAWWRKNYKREDVYDINVKNAAVKLQSFMRGFLVRKKVLRYITLAIYYQSFCDKLQDVLCNNVKNKIFKLFKEKFLYMQKTIKTKKMQKISREIVNKRKQKLNSIFQKRKKKIILRILKKWKDNACKIKLKSKNKENIKNIKAKTIVKDNYNNNYRTQNIQIKSSYNYKVQNINTKDDSNYRSKNMYIKETKVKTEKKPVQQNTSYRKYDNKTYNITQRTTTNKKKEIIQSPLSPRKTTTQLYHKIKSSPYVYSTDNKLKKSYSPDTYSRKNNYENRYYYENNLNKSFDTAYYKKHFEKIKYTTVDDRSNHKTFNRVEVSKEKKRTKSPQFGTLRNKDKKQLTKTIINKNIVTKSTDKKMNIINASTDINKRNSKKIIKTSIQKIPKVQTINRNLNRTTQKTEVISSQKIEKKTYITDEYKYKPHKYSKINNIIDNQISVSILRFKGEGVGEEKLTKTVIVQQPQKIKIKEKVIIQKEMERETAEEGNNFQIFDMEISKIVSLFIKASNILGKKKVDEIQELEVVKKREREKNKEIDKYKKYIEMQKLKNLYDALRHAIRIVEGFKKRILYKKFNQYRNNCFNNNKSFILEIEPMDEFEIKKILKEKKDSSVQIKTSPKNKTITSFKLLKVSEIPKISYLFKKKEKPQKITSSKLNIISKVKKKNQGQQSDSWNKEITNIKIDNINLLYSKTKTRENGSHYPKANNVIGQTRELEILRNKPKMVDDEVQHEYEDNEIEAESLEILRVKPAYKDSTSQYESYKPKIIKEKNLTIIKSRKPPKKIETKDSGCNAIVNTVEEGISAIEKVVQKPKNIEVKIRTVKRSLTKIPIPLLKKLWLRKAFRTFRDNCNRPPFHLILERELLRMAFLRWRFVRGYGPDRYGNAYDRDGNLLYRTRGKVADSQIQNEQIVEQDDQGTQYTPIQNIISTLKNIEFGPSYKRSEKKKTKDVSVGNNIEMEEAIEAMDSFNIKQKKKKVVPNKITNYNFGILIKRKKYKNQETQMPRVKNIIDKLGNWKITNEEYILNKKNSSRLKELLIQIIYKKIISDKLDLSDALRKWLKQTLILNHIEENELENQRRRQTKIKKSDRFSLIEKITKEESSTQVVLPKNKVESNINLNLIKKIKKKNAEINVNLPSQFDLDKIEPQKENKFLVKSSKKPLVLKALKENDMNIYSQDYIFKEEVKRGIHHPMTKEAKSRVTEILLKFFNSRGDPISLLRKYFTIWYRKVQYLTLINNARIISEFCKRNLNRTLNYKKWKRLCERLLLKERLNLVKSSKAITNHINKIFDLIRLTRVNTVFSKKRYIHFMIIAWLAYTRNIKQKRTHVKSLYENMISTYMNLADDVFGNNQKQNPSVQDALFEAVDSNKFQTKDMEDVPLAQEYYEKKKDITKITKTINYFGNYKKNKDDANDNDNYNDGINNKEYIIYKSIVSSHPISTSINSRTNKNEETNSYKIEKSREIREKSIEVKDEDRLHSRGRGRAYRTEYEKNIINKYNKNNLFNDSKKYEKSEDEKEDKEENNNLTQNKYREKRKVNIKYYNNFDENKSDEDEGEGNIKRTNYYERRRRYFRKKTDE